MYLGRIVHVRVDTPLEDIFEKFGMGGLTASQASKVDIKESGTRDLATSFVLTRVNVHMSKVEQADMPKVDRLGMKHVLRDHLERNTKVSAAIEAVQKPTDPIASTSPPTDSTLAYLYRSSTHSDSAD